MMRALLMVVILAGVTVVGCGGSSTGPDHIPNYGGNWSGTYTVTGCTQSGGVGVANICGSIGGSAPYAFVLAQNSRSVTGSFTLGSIAFPSTGATIASDGSLALSATSLSNGITIIVNWALTEPNNVLAGTITQAWTSTTLSGQANVAGTINTAIRASSALPPVLLEPRSLDEAVRALRGAR